MIPRPAGPRRMLGRRRKHGEEVETSAEATEEVQGDTYATIDSRGDPKARGTLRPQDTRAVSLHGLRRRRQRHETAARPQRPGHGWARANRRWCNVHDRNGLRGRISHN